MIDTIVTFLFLYFSKTFFTEIYFQFHNLQFYTPPPSRGRQGAGRPPGGGRGPAALQEGGRDLYVNKKKLFARRPLVGACRPPAATPLGGRGRQAPPPCIKASLPLPPHLIPTTSREQEGERRGEGGSCNDEALLDFGS